MWAALHTDSETLVALKALSKVTRCTAPLSVTERLLQASMSTQSKLFKYVKEEKNILQDLHHPFIITMFAAFQDKETLYMVLEYVPGGDLFSFLSDRSQGDHPGLGETVSEPDAQIYSAELVSERCLPGGELTGICRCWRLSICTRTELFIEI